MKKLTLTIFIFFTALVFVEAQIQKGTYTMRPSLSMSNKYGRVLGKSSNNEPFNVSTSMNYGEFINNNLLISGGIGMSVSNQARNYPTYSAVISTQYYWLENAILKPYVGGGFDFSRDEILQIASNPINIIDTVLHVNQLNASVGTGVQYFINENIALDARFNLTALAITHKNTKQLYDQAYTINLRPFYTASSYQAAKKMNHFFYKGKTEIAGSIGYYPKVINLTGGSATFYTGFSGNYSLNKWFGVGTGFSYVNSGSFYKFFTASISTEANIKLLKRLYLSPNLGVGLRKEEVSKAIISINTNLVAKYFINKNIAWTANFLSFELYASRKSNLPTQNVFFNTGVAYYLK